MPASLTTQGAFRRTISIRAFEHTRALSTENQVRTSETYTCSVTTAAFAFARTLPRREASITVVAVAASGTGETGTFSTLTVSLLQRTNVNLVNFTPAQKPRPAIAAGVVASPNYPRMSSARSPPRTFHLDPTYPCRSASLCSSHAPPAATRSNSLGNNRAPIILPGIRSLLARSSLNRPTAPGHTAQRPFARPNIARPNIVKIATKPATVHPPPHLHHSVPKPLNASPQNLCAIVPVHPCDTIPPNHAIVRQSSHHRPRSLRTHQPGTHSHRVHPRHRLHLFRLAPADLPRRAPLPSHQLLLSTLSHHELRHLATAALNRGPSPNESTHDAHIRIGAAFAAQAQLEELDMVSLPAPTTLPNCLAYPSLLRPSLNAS